MLGLHCARGAAATVSVRWAIISGCFGALLAEHGDAKCLKNMDPGWLKGRMLVLAKAMSQAEQVGAVAKYRGHLSWNFGSGDE